MISSELQLAQPKLKRRWLQYSLRSLLLFVLLWAIACNWFATRMQQVRKQRDAVKVFRQFPGGVTYDYQYSGQKKAPPGPAWLRKWLGDDWFANVEVVCLGCNKKFTDAEMAHVEALPRLKVLRLYDAAITDAGMEHLKVLTQLKELSLGRTKITDAGLENIKGLKQLERLSLSGNKMITGTGLEDLEGLPQLKELRLYDAKITDAGLEHVKGLTGLQALYLDKARVTDVGLVHLQGLSQLRELSLFGTQVTGAGVKKLREALPNCKIAWEPPTPTLSE
ncbi:MAG: leucine-rich repeat domain-containing protein [Thermoguttaceae bacterium]